MSETLVTRNFYLSEFIVSDIAVRLGIDNTPSASITATLVNVLIPAMQDVRDIIGKPILVKSGYRCPALNEAVRGAQGSQHMDGHACDFVSPSFGTPSQIASFLVDRMSEVNFDQLILEGGWVHVSFAPRRRNEVLTAHFTSQGVSYTQGLS
jgi:Peptidase M15